jgi:RNA polymerase sigma-70 factor (ECF subfamily)
MDEKRLRAEYSKHSGTLLAHVRGLIRGDRQHAEDIVQETFLRLWQNPPVLAETRTSVRAWLFTVASRIVIDRWRRARLVEVSDDGAATLLAATSLSDDEMDQVLTRWLVHDALNSLSPNHRAVIIEMYYRGQSLADTARALGVPVGTVQSRRHYAIRALRLALEERGLVG